jgi:hypothetical protein
MLAACVAAAESTLSPILVDIELIRNHHLVEGWLISTDRPSVRLGTPDGPQGGL